jgi:hypothetical protein
MDRKILSRAIYPVDGTLPKSADVFYRECMKKHSGKIPTIHRSDREFTIDLFLHDVKIRKKMNEFITDIPIKEKLRNLFF